MRDGTSLGSVGTLRLLGALLGATLVVAACDDSSDSAQGTGGTSTAGKTGSSGSGSTASGAGGSSSSAAGASSSGAAGSSATVGGTASGGSVAQGGSNASAGQGGTASGDGGEAAGAECETSQDCTVLDNCCSCSAVPDSSSPGACDQVCIQSACAAQGLEGIPAVCSKKRCVFELSCDRSLVTCKAAAPSCADGMIPSVQGSCWGPCVPASECTTVTDCDDCAPNQACVKSEGLASSTIHCVPVTAECAAAPSCDCTNACEFQCSDVNDISCYCIQC